jgi:equilibrative nucleoside transporter 1/2/3
MDGIKHIYRRVMGDTSGLSYQPLEAESPTSETEPLRPSDEEESEDQRQREEGETEVARQLPPFIWIDYLVFVLLGVAMLWAWNMFLAAGPYFQRRFRSNDWISKNFQPAELTVSTISNLSSVLLFTFLQAKANYARRIVVALIANIVCFTLLSMSTCLFTNVSASGYFGFLLVEVLAASITTGLMQNGIYAYVSGFGREEYTQGIMTGQAIAGVAPPIVQLVSVLSTPSINAQGETAGESSTSALAYFATATGLSFLTLLAFLQMATRRRNTQRDKHLTEDLIERNDTPRKSVPLWILFKKTRWLSSAVFLTFGITMFFPVFTQRILSVKTSDDPPRLLEPASFIPLAFFFWNAGDLTGRLLTALPALLITSKPHSVLILSVARILWVPLYYLCNIDGKGAIINSDFFYLLVVQFSFGLSNGFVGSTCMMGAVEYVEPEEREAAGGFMGLMLVGGMTLGSLLSFLVA